MEILDFELERLKNVVADLSELIKGIEEGNQEEPEESGAEEAVTSKPRQKRPDQMTQAEYNAWRREGGGRRG